MNRIVLTALLCFAVSQSLCLANVARQASQMSDNALKSLPKLGCPLTMAMNSAQLPTVQPVAASPAMSLAMTHTINGMNNMQSMGQTAGFFHSPSSINMAYRMPFDAVGYGFAGPSPMGFGMAAVHSGMGIGRCTRCQ